MPEVIHSEEGICEELNLKRNHMVGCICCINKVTYRAHFVDCPIALLHSKKQKA